MVFFGSASIVLITLMLIKLFSRVMGFGSVPDKPSRPARTFVPEQRLPQIPAAPNAMQSVTEHTTRNFEPRAYERGTRE